MVYLQSVKRLYSLFTAYRKTIWSIYGLLEGRTVHLRTISRTYGQLRAPFKRQPRRYLGRDFLRISFIFYSFILYISFVFYGFIKANYRGYTQAVLFLKYCQCIIIVLVIQRNFLCFSFVFYSLISYIFLYFCFYFL